ncbi:MAG: ABC transporter permease [Bacteroidia bacterium]|nr:ABC transporter permease [Bacteroidia bacterium]NNF31464.1 ABC transporter permease [Flavobacteriaceae bacterium]MBT8275539.1 ABC transporter permease [Bacteroidia bacterium]NNJ82061.1 ABC transporter permease [Flavobacteriaceae bacterium]NNK54043.1 ABC transporter permease [Flavobacteriaceae bacterium]
MNFPFYIAKRYLFSKSSNNAINVITIIAATGVVIGAMSLFIVLSAFSGLKDFSLQFTNVFDSDLKIVPASGKTITFNEELAEKFDKVAEISAYSKIIEERAFLQYKGKNHIAYIKGVDSNYVNVVPVDSILYLSEWFQYGRNEVVIGTATALKLSIGINDYTNLLEIYVPTPGTGQITELNIDRAFTRERAVAVGFYEVNEDVNGKYVFSDFELAQSLLSLDSTVVSSIEIKLQPDTDEELVKAKIFEILQGQDILVKNRIQQNDALYKMLNTENIAVYLIFTLVLIIALFNVIGSIIMMILDKRKNIKTLFNMGTTLRKIRLIFFLQGTLMTTLGGLLGILLGIIIVWLQMQSPFVYITSSLPYPVKLKAINIVVVFVTITLLGIVASKIASNRVKASLLD